MSRFRSRERPNTLLTAKARSCILEAWFRRVGSSCVFSKIELAGTVHPRSRTPPLRVGLRRSSLIKLIVRAGSGES